LIRLSDYQVIGEDSLSGVARLPRGLSGGQASAKTEGQKLAPREAEGTEDRGQGEKSQEVTKWR